MRRYKSLLIIMLVGLVSTSAYAFWGTGQTPTPPYDCSQLRLKSATQGTEPGKRSYIFSGVCMMKVGGNSKKLWLKVSASWETKENKAVETAHIVGGDSGKMRLVMHCEDDPWISNGRCVLDEKMSSASFDQFLAVFKAPAQAQDAPGLAHPPLARGIMTAAQINSVLSLPVAQKTIANQTAQAVSAVKDKAVDAARSVQQVVKDKVTGPAFRALQDKQKLFDKPRYKGYPVHLCYRWHGQCGVPAANAWCKSKGYKRALDWVEEHNVGRSAVMGDNRLCTREACDAFASITCTR